MKKIWRIVIGVVVVLVGIAWIVNAWFKETYGDTGLYKMKGCYQDDDAKLTYKIVGAFKGLVTIEIVATEGLSSKTVGTRDHIRAGENPNRIYPVKCP